MNLYLVTQNENDDYDTFDSMVVAAESEKRARHMTPGSLYEWGDDAWCSSPDKASVRKIGVAVLGMKAEVILTSFNAG